MSDDLQGDALLSFTSNSQLRIMSFFGRFLYLIYFWKFFVILTLRTVELFWHTCFVERGACTPPPPYNLNFCIWYEVETWVSDSPWLKGTIDDIFLVTYLLCKQPSKNCLEAKSLDKVDDITNLLHLLRGILSVSFNIMSCQEVEKWKRLIFSKWNVVTKLWVVVRISVYTCADTSHFQFGGAKIVLRKFC